MGGEYGECHGDGEGVVKMEAGAFNTLSVQLLWGLLSLIGQNSFTSCPYFFIFTISVAWCRMGRAEGKLREVTMMLDFCI